MEAMKSRWTTYVLLLVVSVVWGAIAWKIFAPKPEGKAVAPSPVAKTAPASSADTLCCDYPDPFLKETPAKTKSRASASARRSAAGPRKPAARPRSKPVALQHLGTIRAGRRTLHILLVGQTQHELYVGEEADGYLLGRIDADSLYLEREGVTYGVKRCE